MLWMGIWMHPYAVLHMQVGVSFMENGVWLSLYDVVVSWLRLQTPIDCIPHPYWMYTKSFSTLRCWCGWAYGCTLVLQHYMCRWGEILGKMGYGRACMMLRHHGWGLKPPLTASHIHIGCIQSVLAPWDAVNGHMGAPLECVHRHFFRAQKHKNAPFPPKKRCLFLFRCARSRGGLHIKIKRSFFPPEEM